jgi:ribulose-phosphate 3-epimerase
METDVVNLAPPIPAADPARLGVQASETEQAGADRIHPDGMDEHFVPDLSMGAPIVQSRRRVTRLPLEIQLEIRDPDFFSNEFVEAGSDPFLVHWDGNANLHRTVQPIKRLGKRARVVIHPATRAAVLEEILEDVGQVLIIRVNPGFGHQYFLPASLQKIRRVRQMIEKTESRCDVEVDGSIDRETAPLAVAAGADVLVAGRAIFGENEDVAQSMDRPRAGIEQLWRDAQRVE